jgi:hypothetical protein
MSTSTLVRTDLTPSEWKRIRKLAIEREVRISKLAGDALRALLKGGKP